ncbi:hypothetical protein EW145_g3593 [Phellinidium pouzarii]|uniref:Uncharacterized protein n=1 Tax=Phellinidium pouzarii TaxID=167371 RepID=A0A4S4L828_9AGAM|nr:hypothetical protein EW145_g3593 [Phellinidium pouzarii]
MVAGFRSNSLEDIVFIAIHGYLLFITVYAIAYESIPHIIMIFATRFLSAVWAIGRVIETLVVKKNLHKLLSAARCQPGFFEPSFYSDRHIFEGCLVGISVVSVVIEAFVATKLGQTFSKRPWRVVQVSSEMRKMYRLLLGFSVIVQMAGLILPATVALWVEQILNTSFKDIVGSHRYIYLPISLFVTIALPIWMTLGWFSLRRERTRATLVFFFLGLIILSCWSISFASPMFRWTFTTWWFFATIYVGSTALLCAALVLALLCRRNFGNNLDHYLLVQSRLSAMGFAHGHFEKDEKLNEAEVSSDLDEKFDEDRSSWGYGLEKVSLSD